MDHHLPSHTGPHFLSRGAQRGILKNVPPQSGSDRLPSPPLVESGFPAFASPETRIALGRSATSLSPLFDTCWTAPIVHIPKWTLSARPARGGIRVGEPTAPETFQPVDVSAFSSGACVLTAFPVLLPSVFPYHTQHAPGFLPLVKSQESLHEPPLSLWTPRAFPHAALYNASIQKLRLLLCRFGLRRLEYHSTHKLTGFGGNRLLVIRRARLLILVPSPALLSRHLQSQSIQLLPFRALSSLRVLFPHVPASFSTGALLQWGPHVGCLVVPFLDLPHLRHPTAAAHTLQFQLEHGKPHVPATLSSPPLCSHVLRRIQCRHAQRGARKHHVPHQPCFGPVLLETPHHSLTTRLPLPTAPFIRSHCGSSGSVMPSCLPIMCRTILTHALSGCLHTFSTYTRLGALSQMLPCIQAAVAALSHQVGHGRVSDSKHSVVNGKGVYILPSSAPSRSNF
uniref:Uncharacterized protein TCIL3000_5_670 n=1 Tax=Trypanosoma congolense (strain IL3000) TaxID=1068625 RepID=G0UMG7_TRYCI|nr:unnamed protein product [Trypanosoma congolense IL3000]